MTVPWNFSHARVAGDPNSFSPSGMGRGRTVDEWKLPAHRPDNHWLDCVVGCAATASMQGAQRVGAATGARPQAKRIKLAEIQRRRSDVRMRS